MTKRTIAGIIVAIGLLGLSAFVSKKLCEKPMTLAVLPEDDLDFQKFAETNTL